MSTPQGESRRNYEQTVELILSALSPFHLQSTLSTSISSIAHLIPSNPVSQCWRVWEGSQVTFVRLTQNLAGQKGYKLVNQGSS